MNDFAMIYHWWNDSGLPVVEDMANPVILSIITVRHFHKDLPIYVLDISETLNDWGEFPSILNFEVVKRSAPKEVLNHFKLAKGTSRIWDITWMADQIESNKIIFCDSDIFWIDPVFPLLGFDADPKFETFHCGMNNGFFYYDKTSFASNEVWGKVKDIAEERDDFFSDRRLLQDERIFRRVIETTDFFTPVSFKENNIIFAGGQSLYSCHGWSPHPNFNEKLNAQIFEEWLWHHPGVRSHLFNERFKKDCKNIHVMSRFGGADKGKVFCLIDELKDILIEFLSQNQIKIPIDFKVKSFPYSQYKKNYLLKHFYSQIEDNDNLFGYKFLIREFKRNAKYC
jgi:hypothetical protein